MTKALTRAVMFVEELRKLDPELPMQLALALLFIAQQEGATQSEVMQRLGTTKSSVGRIFARLSEEGYRTAAGEVPGLGLIEVRPGQQDARQRQAYLTAAGRRYIQSLLHYVG